MLHDVTTGSSAQLRQLRPKVAIVHSRMERGGSEALVMWGVEALKHDFDVSIISTNQIDLSSFNSFYGTAVQPDEITIRQLQIPVIFHWTRSLSAMRGTLFQRALAATVHEYDVLISAYNLCDFGVPAIHLVDLGCNGEFLGEFAPPPQGIAGIVHRVAPLRGAYRQMVRMLARPSGRDLFAGEDLLLAYSQWIATKVEQRLQTRCGVLYPPVPGMFKYVPFNDRNSEFVCLGRVSEEKRLERVIEILGRIRNHGYDLKLRLIGAFESNVYARRIHALAQKLPWISIEGRLSQRRKEEVLSECAYGIHGAEGEGFGIAVAEMVNAGCITFAPVEGGPAEILNHDALLYRDDDDAVDKIMGVLRDAELQQKLLVHLRQQAGKFSAENYMRELYVVVERFIDSKRERSAFSQSTKRQGRRVSERPFRVRRKQKLSVAIVHPRLNRGGSETAVMWVAEALKRDFAVSIVTGGPVELDELNRFCGTVLETHEVTIRQLAIPFAFAYLSGAEALRGAYFQRAIRSIVADYDVLISAYNLCDFGVPAIHRIADFSWSDELRRTFDSPPGGLRGLFHRVAWLRGAYLGLTDKVAFSLGRRSLPSENVIIANSQWTAAILHQRFGIVAEVIYPPVTGEFLDIPHERRRDDFVCINRISPEKRIDRMIQIIGAVRSHGHNVRIRIIGSLDNSPYSRTIASLARRHPEWVLLEGECVGEKKARIMAECRYGVHGREGEAFGIAVAEMTKAGCITFVPAEGGPAEIVGHNPTLLYHTPDEAVEKIDSMLRNPGIQSAARAFIEQRAQKFSAENFMHDIRRVVGEFVSSHGQVIGRETVGHN